MSLGAITWALEQPVRHSSAKFVLTVMANFADAGMLCWPSTALLAEATSQDRKTVLENVKRLREWGYLEDTGERKGATKQVVVYRLKSPKSGTVATPNSAAPATDIEPKTGTVEATETVPDSGQLSAETVPNFPVSADSNSPVFPHKRSQISVETVPFSPRNSPKNGTRNRKNLQGTVMEPPGEIVPPIELPPWLPKNAWDDYCKHRGKKFTQRAKELALKKLEQLRRQGSPPEEVLNQSVMNGWKGIFALKDQGNGKRSIHDKRAATIAGLTGGSGRVERDITPDSVVVG